MTGFGINGQVSLIQIAVNKLYVVANESYEDFARALQQEYEEDCGVTFGKVPIQAFAKIVKVVDEQEKPLGRDESKTIWSALITHGLNTQNIGE